MWYILLIKNALKFSVVALDSHRKQHFSYITVVLLPDIPSISTPPPPPVSHHLLFSVASLSHAFSASYVYNVIGQAHAERQKAHTMCSGVDVVCAVGIVVVAIQQNHLAFHNVLLF